MLFLLAILFYHVLSSFFFNIDFYLYIYTAVFGQIFLLTSELIISIRVETKEAKTVTEVITHPATTEAKISKY